MAVQPCWRLAQEFPRTRRRLPPMPSSSCPPIFRRCRHEHLLKLQPQRQNARKLVVVFYVKCAQLREVYSMIPIAKAKLLEPKKGLVVGIANDQSIAWGWAKAFRELGAELAVTY